MADDDDEGSFGGEFENGHWAWDEVNNELVFVSDLPPELVETVAVTVKVPTGTVEFRDDIDLIEQLRFRKRYQRKLKLGQPDIITVQDVKDLALFTAPVSLLSPMLINMLHLSTTDRFIRALILYCQYYLEIAEEMSNRILELETKVRTPYCDVLEHTYRENISDLRTLVAKEYCTMLIGGHDTKKFHHMGPQKKRRSLSDKDARLFETLLRICIQIVWLALSRRSFNQIELEVNRVFKSEIFNSVEHTLRTNYISKMSKEERGVLLGHCVRHDKKLNTRSPLINEVFCHRPIDYRMMGLGVIKYDELTPRLRYMLMAIGGPEEDLVEMGVTVGILGISRSCFDTMLHVLPTVLDSHKKSKSSFSSASSSAPGFSKSATASVKSTGSMKGSPSSKTVDKLYVYNNIILPEKDEVEPEFPQSFPDESAQVRPCSETQRKRWQTRLHRLLHPPKNKRKSII
ncbi:protein phosphatase 1 regulatory subunit 36-like [Pectinophora gossypiella]|uniref:protein phosphatase 1 regulatory subunit 36-like n=1 Tax=Pectinophora gossypiella TaxID=13191 RepID=UPI00214F02B1|nr:protein phosphatase 1 regulatory subunit 36-like [Pectinophora gossypiella]